MTLAKKEATKTLEKETETELERLAILQRLDRHLREKAEVVATLEREVSSMEIELNAEREAVRALRSGRSESDEKRRALEARLEEEGGKMKERRMRLNRVRNEKELSALRREIEIGKELNQQLETEVIAAMQELESLDTALGERERTLAALEEKFASEIVGHRQRILGLTGEVKSERVARDEVAESLSRELRGKYEQIFARRGGTTVVEIRNGTCMGCHMHVPPQFFNELQRTKDVRLCPNCHRILIWRPESTEASATRTTR
jgi:predicted  nucleic acid-binding Zn-ribbon protein